MAEDGLGPKHVTTRLQLYVHQTFCILFYDVLPWRINSSSHRESKKLVTEITCI